MSQQSNQHTHSIQASGRDGSHHRVQTYPVEHINETVPYDLRTRANLPPSGDPQYQWYQARGEPPIQTVSRSDYRTPQHYTSVDAHSGVGVEGDADRVPWREGISQNAGALYTQDSRTTQFIPPAPTTIHSPHDRQQNTSSWEAGGHGRRGSEPRYEHSDAYGFSSPEESHRRGSVPTVPSGTCSPMNPGQERHEPPMVPRHPSLQSFGPYTTTVLQPGRNSSTMSGDSDHSRSRSTSHTLHSAHQQFQSHHALQNPEAPQYVVPSSRIPRADLTTHTSPPSYYNTTGMSHSPEEISETKPKRRRANAAQLQLLNDTYARTMFPTTEERADIARRINMTPRQVQIWFQNRRQASRQSQTPSGSTLEGLYGEENSDYLHENEND